MFFCSSCCAAGPSQLLMSREVLYFAVVFWTYLTVDFMSSALVSFTALYTESTSQTTSSPSRTNSNNAAPFGFLSYNGPDPNISKYDPFLYPVIKKVPPKGQKLKARFFSGIGLETSTQGKHIIWEGLARSEMFEMDKVWPTQIVRPMEPPTIALSWIFDDIWVIDATFLKACDRMVSFVRRTVEMRPEYNCTHHWTILVVDYWDHTGMEETLLWPPDNCMDKISDAMHSGGPPTNFSLRYAKRSLTINRWDETKNFVELGPFLVEANFFNSGPVLHIPYCVRTDTVRAVHNIANGTHPVDAVRSLDVAHYYRKQGTTRYYDNLRLSVNNLLVELSTTPDPFGKQNANSSAAQVRVPDVILAHAGVVGNDRETGRFDAQEAYVRHMMGTKIIVVAQRDGWSDHWRLFEALASGAMVMHDVMNVLPRGLRHGENIVIYDSLPDLRQQILYYLHPNNERERLSIARKGWEMAMGYHRSWHCMETVIFGRPLTRVGDTSVV